MKVTIVKESERGEKRVALIPDSCKRLAGIGTEILLETGAGGASGYEDGQYQEVGATVVPSANEALRKAECLVKVKPPMEDEVKTMPSGSTLISLLQPTLKKDLVQLLCQRRITAFALDMIPRTTLAQSMDVLSSMSTIAGYKAVILAADNLDRFFPMLMTAAGTVAPAKVLVLGAGVAGLMACATAKRLGGVVEAFDVRAEVKEQVQSVGARFIEVPVTENGSGQGGYAKEMSEDYKAKQAELITRHLAKSDVVIPTALIPGRRAPILISEEQVKKMRPGAVIVDIAAEMGGNCALTKPDETVVAHGVIIMGLTNLPSEMAYHASQMFSKNVEKYLGYLSPEGSLRTDRDDEIIGGSLITHEGQVVHKTVRDLMDS